MRQQDIHRSGGGSQGMRANTVDGHVGKVSVGAILARRLPRGARAVASNRGDAGHGQRRLTMGPLSAGGQVGR